MFSLVNAYDWRFYESDLSMNKSHEPLTSAEIIEQAKLAINPRVPNWVLFAGGTYVIIEEEAELKAPREHAIERLKEFGPVAAGGPAGDFSVIRLNNTDGWVVSGHGYGIYTYVHPRELSADPSQVEIGLYGRSKRHEDSQGLEVIHVNGEGTGDG